MKTFKRVAASLCAIAASSSAYAVPMQEQSLLPPLTTTQVDFVRSLTSGDEELSQMLEWVHTLKVYADHKDENKFFIAPYLQADEEAYAIGGQEIADAALVVLDEVDKLADLMNFSVNKAFQIAGDITAKNRVLNNLNKDLNEANTPELRQQINAEIDNVEREIAALRARFDRVSTQGAEDLSPQFLQDIANAIFFQMSRLGYSPSSTERSQLANANNPQGIRSAIISIRARVANTGDFGVRQAVFSNGLTNEQKRYWSLYRQAKSEIQLVALPASAVYAESTAVTSQNADNGSGHVEGLQRILNVNGGTDGRCGSVNSCVASINYTAMGARSASASKYGVSILGVTFSADVRMTMPDFHGKVECDFVTGWEAKGRNDVKDGAIIYDGDVSSRVKFYSKEEGGCDKTIYEGDEDSADYHTIEHIYKTYMDMKLMRGQRAKIDKDRYEQYVRDELHYHARNSQSGKSRDPWYTTISSWVPSWGGFGLRVATSIFGGARNFYWHTRVEDTGSYDNVKFTTTIEKRNTTKTLRMNFSGNPTVCWVRRSTNLNEPAVLAACPAIVDTIDEQDTPIGQEEDTCENYDAFGECLDAVNNAPADDNGVVEQPIW